MLCVSYISGFKNGLKEKENMGYINQENKPHWIFQYREFNIGNWLHGY